MKANDRVAAEADRLVQKVLKQGEHTEGGARGGESRQSNFVRLYCAKTNNTRLRCRAGASVDEHVANLAQHLSASDNPADKLEEKNFGEQRSGNCVDQPHKV